MRRRLPRARRTDTLCTYTTRFRAVLDRGDPSLVERRDTTQETVVFGKLSGEGRVVYLVVLDAPHTIRYAPVAGEFRELHANSLGKALLSMLDPDARHEIGSAHV